MNTFLAWLLHDRFVPVLAFPVASGSRKRVAGVPVPDRLSRYRAIRTINRRRRTQPSLFDFLSTLVFHQPTFRDITFPITSGLIVLNDRSSVFDALHLINGPTSLRSFILHFATPQSRNFSRFLLI